MKRYQNLKYIMIALTFSASSMPPTKSHFAPQTAGSGSGTTAGTREPFAHPGGATTTSPHAQHANRPTAQPTDHVSAEAAAAQPAEHNYATTLIFQNEPWPKECRNILYYICANMGVVAALGENKQPSMRNLYTKIKSTSPSTLQIAQYNFQNADSVNITVVSQLIMLQCSIGTTSFPGLHDIPGFTTSIQEHVKKCQPLSIAQLASILDASIKTVRPHIGATFASLEPTLEKLQSVAESLHVQDIFVQIHTFLNEAIALLTSKPEMKSQTYFILSTFSALLGACGTEQQSLNTISKYTMTYLAGIASVGIAWLAYHLLTKYVFDGNDTKEMHTSSTVILTNQLLNYEKKFGTDFTNCLQNRNAQCPSETQLQNFIYVLFNLTESAINASTAVSSLLFAAPYTLIQRANNLTKFTSYQYANSSVTAQIIQTNGFSDVNNAAVLSNTAPSSRTYNSSTIWPAGTVFDINDGGEVFRASLLVSTNINTNASFDELTGHFAAQDFTFSWEAGAFGFAIMYPNRTVAPVSNVVSSGITNPQNLIMPVTGKFYGNVTLPDGTNYNLPYPNITQPALIMNFNQTTVTTNPLLTNSIGFFSRLWRNSGLAQSATAFGNYLLNGVLLFDIQNSGALNVCINPGNVQMNYTCSAACPVQFANGAFWNHSDNAVLYYNSAYINTQSTFLLDGSCDNNVIPCMPFFNLPANNGTVSVVFPTRYFSLNSNSLDELPGGAYCVM